MSFITILLLICINVTCFIWGWSEGSHRLSQKLINKVRGDVTEQIDSNARKAFREYVHKVADNRKEAIYARTLFITYIVEEIEALPDWTGTKDEAEQYAFKIFQDFEKEHRQEFEDNFDAAIDQSAERAMHANQTDNQTAQN